MKNLSDFDISSEIDCRPDALLCCCFSHSCRTASATPLQSRIHPSPTRSAPRSATGLSPCPPRTVVRLAGCSAPPRGSCPPSPAAAAVRGPPDSDRREGLLHCQSHPWCVYVPAIAYCLLLFVRGWYSFVLTVATRAPVVHLWYAGVNKGKWYYEVTIRDGERLVDRPEPHARVGWSLLQSMATRVCVNDCACAFHMHWLHMHWR